ncbi:MAG: peptide-N-glycosidase F-related protein, partial [Anaerolineae bacterium]
KSHPEASTLMGCAEQVVDGVVPNQGGTWIYGRGGWCPGLDVKPWVIDITDEVHTGELNVLTYRGLFNGEDYVPEKGPDQDPNEAYDARIRLKTFLVYSAGEDVEPGPVTPPRPRVPGTIYMPTTLNAFAR